MNRVGLAIVLSMGALTLLLWWLVNRPGMEPPWPAQIDGVSFSPIRAGMNPSLGEFPSAADIDADLALLAGDVAGVRTYTVQATMAQVPRLAADHDLNVTLGAWLNDQAAFNNAELDRLIQTYRANPDPVVRVIVGNESIHREEQTVVDVIGHVHTVKQAVAVPVSTAEPWYLWLRHPELVDAVDFIAVHLLPYWEGIALEQAIEHVFSQYRRLQAAYPDKPIVISEVGWPSHGRTLHGAVATPANQARFLRRFLAAAEREELVYYVMEAFDQPWKSRLEGQAGAHWGIYDAAREAKFAFVSPIVPVPNWTSLAAISIGLAIVLLALLLRDSRGLSAGGSGFLALIAYGLTTFVVWLLYDFTQQYMNLGLLIVTGALLLSAAAIIVLLLAEAHEWAESLWRRRDRQAPLPLRERATVDTLPRVAIHVPIYNEPADMVIASLDALANLDYPDFEVLVVDNNTPDPAVWRPVEAHCRELGGRFRFFHVAPLDGFKAGALNFALAHTDPGATVIGVIDSDYQVEPSWLRELAPLFDDPEITIVQAPQDYRDGHESLFKAMCEAEYRGFFHIGMVTRNERDAIIQHGTMTLVRRSSLASVDGWSEWCITEDAELGLKLFEQGHSALYIPKSYGRGLIPDTFVDFKKQRFRWAYGAMRILRAHFAKLFGLRRSALTPGQRYHFVAGWLPWLADGLNLAFNLAAIAWTTAMVLAPERIAPPHPVFVALPLTLFAFKLSKLLVLYRWRVRASLSESVAAGLAGLALSHVIARAMLTGCVDRGVDFFRTPKLASTRGLRRALHDAREELLFLVALCLGAMAVLWREDGSLLDVRLWSAMLLVQAVPYAATVIVSMISAAPGLPGRLVVRGPGSVTQPSA
ncbi:MAG: glycosyltransferase family 2 protein [Gammaproteobacteria bacterium]|nr:glycosyltransferase family 2 protein [Gammaproteobacteria bacterium]